MAGFLRLARGERRITIKRGIKSLLSNLFSGLLRIAAPLREGRPASMPMLHLPRS